MHCSKRSFKTFSGKPDQTGAKFTVETQIHGVSVTAENGISFYFDDDEIKKIYPLRFPVDVTKYVQGKFQGGVDLHKAGLQVTAHKDGHLRFDAQADPCFWFEYWVFLGGYIET
tara:strand:+ start:168 stop:509 length:342 start_codon:yes stop_codon:yes gene_type:complete